jgi:uncharacterized protein YbcI
MIEDEVCTAIGQFEHEHMGRRPKSIDCFLVRDLLVLRLQDILTPAEQNLVKTSSAQAGRDLVKLLRTNLVEISRPMLQRMVEEITGVGVLNLHHDVSTINGEEVFLFSLDKAPVTTESAPT